MAKRAPKTVPPRPGPTRGRRGNHPSNPYAAGDTDREGLSLKANLTDEAQLGRPSLGNLVRRDSPAKPPNEPPREPDADDPEPTFVLRASDPLSGMVLRCWAGLNEHLYLPNARNALAARELAAQMDAWREKNSGGG